MAFVRAQETMVHLVSFWNIHPESGNKVVGRLCSENEGGCGVWNGVGLGTRILC